MWKHHHQQHQQQQRKAQITTGTNNLCISCCSIKISSGFYALTLVAMEFVVNTILMMATWKRFALRTSTSKGRLHQRNQQIFSLANFRVNATFFVILLGFFGQAMNHPDKPLLNIHIIKKTLLKANAKLQETSVDSWIEGKIFVLWHTRNWGSILHTDRIMMPMPMPMLKWMNPICFIPCPMYGYKFFSLCNNGKISPATVRAQCSPMSTCSPFTMVLTLYINIKNTVVYYGKALETSPSITAE